MNHTEITDYARPTVFYDGACPMCSREIAHYRRLDRGRNLNWIDISREPVLLQRLGLDQDALMRRFHILDSRGRWQTGAWGFSEMWANLPYYRWLSAVLQLPGLLSLLDTAYQPFARWRLRRRCGDGVCGTPETGSR